MNISQPPYLIGEIGGGTPFANFANFAKSVRFLAEERRLMIGNDLAILAKNYRYRQFRQLNLTQHLYAPPPSPPPFFYRRRHL